MRKLTLVLLVSSPRVTAVSAGTATFSPATIRVPPGTPSVSFDINVGSAEVGFDSANLIVGFSTAGAANLLSWSYTPAWITAMAASVQTPGFGTGAFPAYGDWVNVGGASGGPSFAALDLGTVTIDTSALPNGTYTIQIDGANDFGFSNLGLAGVSETISGLGTLEICLGWGCDQTPPDCNSNGVDDALDIASGTSTDGNDNGVPDECQVLLAGDFNGDGSVGPADYATFGSCLTAPCDNPPCAPALYVEPCCVLAGFQHRRRRGPGRLRCLPGGLHRSVTVPAGIVIRVNRLACSAGGAERSAQCLESGYETRYRCSEDRGWRVGNRDEGESPHARHAGGRRFKSCIAQST